MAAALSRIACATAFQLASSPAVIFSDLCRLAMRCSTVSGWLLVAVLAAARGAGACAAAGETINGLASVAAPNRAANAIRQVIGDMSKTSFWTVSALHR